MARKKSSLPRWKKLLAAGVTGSTLIAAAVFGTKALPSFLGEEVVEVVDGDTFIIKNRQSIRLYGINAPELTNCMGQDAKNALSNLILGKRVIIKEPLSDDMGRVMALVYTDGTLVNKVMVRSGLAVYHRQGGSETKTLDAADTYAREHSVGIFSPTCLQTKPPDPSCAIKGNWDERKNEKLYFPPDCNYYSLVNVALYQGDRWFCSEKEAEKAGFVKSGNCEE